MLDKALIQELGNVKDSDNLLLKALLYVISYTLDKKTKKKKEKSDDEYDLQDAFNDAFRGKSSNRLPKVSSLANALIPKPS